MRPPAPSSGTTGPLHDPHLLTQQQQIWDREGRQSAALARGSDARRDTYVSTDPSTGRQFYHGQAAYDPARGGVVNPYRPTELLTPAPHWQGR